MSSPEVTPFTPKKNTDALENSSVTVVGLQRMTDNHVAMAAASNLIPLRDQLLSAGAVAGADQTAEAECISASKRASLNIADFNEMAVRYGSITGSEALTSIVIDGDGVVVAEQMIIPALEGLHDPIANSLATLGSSLVKEHRAAEKAHAKATAKAEASNAKWSEIFVEISERIREGRALQTINGLDVPSKRKAASRRAKGGDPVEPPPIEAGTHAETPVISTPTPAPAPQPVNSTPAVGGATGSGPPPDPIKVAG